MQCKGKSKQQNDAGIEIASGSGDRATYAKKLRGNKACTEEASTAEESLQPAKRLKTSLDDSDAEGAPEEEEEVAVETPAVEAQASTLEPITVAVETRTAAQLAMARLRERVRHKQRLMEEADRSAKELARQ